MKKLMILLAAVVMFFTACNKNDNNNTTGGNNNYYFTAKIDGVDFAADMSSTVTEATKPHAGFLTLSAAKTDVLDGAFLVNISNYTGTGTYSVGTGNNYARHTVGNIVNGQSWEASDKSGTSGEVIVTSDNNGVIEGTFSFIGLTTKDNSSKIFSDGKFRMKIK